MKIVTTGSRHWTNEQLLIEIMDGHLNEFLKTRRNYNLEVAHGKSKGGGADLFVANWCWDNRNRVTEWPFPVVPDLDGRHIAAPLNRNKRMVASFFPDLLVAFRAAGKSNGTDQCVAYAQSLGYPTQVNDES